MQLPKFILLYLILCVAALTTYAADADTAIATAQQAYQQKLDELNKQMSSKSEALEKAYLTSAEKIARDHVEYLRKVQVYEVKKGNLDGALQAKNAISALEEDIKNKQLGHLKSKPDVKKKPVDPPNTKTPSGGGLLAAYYDFNAIEDGIIRDRSKNANNLQIKGEVKSTQGVRGKGVYFRHGMLLNESPKGLPKGSEERTMSVWIKTIDRTKRNTIVGGFGNNQANQNFQIGIGGSLQLMGWIPTNDWMAPIKPERVKDGKWHHIVVTHKDGISHYYVDGQQLATTKKYKFGTNPVRIVIGEEIDKAGRPFKGFIDEFMILRKAFGPDDIKRMYMAQKPREGGEIKPGPRRPDGDRPHKPRPQKPPEKPDPKPAPEKPNPPEKDPGNIDIDIP